MESPDKLSHKPSVPGSSLDPAYLTLLERFPLESIRDDAQLGQALDMIDQTLHWDDRPPGAQRYLDALTDLVATYETMHVRLPEASGVDALRFLMEENALTQADLVPLFGTPSIVSEVLSGKRRLALAHIQRLSERFGLPADVFIDKDASVLAG